MHHVVNGEPLVTGDAVAPSRGGGGGCCCCYYSCFGSYLQSASLHHDLLPLWLNSGQGEQLSLEHHGRLLCVQLDAFKLLLPPFDVDYTK